MSLNRLITLLAIVMLISVGCGKKKKDDTAAQPPKAEIETVKDTADIFDEFYDDDEATNDNINEDEYASTEAPEFNPNGRYVVQVSCVLSKALAEDVVRQLESKGYPAYISEVENPTTSLLGVYHRIRIGGFTGISDAKSFGENQLSDNGYEYWVDNKSNDNIGIGGYGLGETQESSTYDSYESSDSYEETTTDSYDSYETTETVSEPEPTPEPTPEPVVEETVTETPAATDDFGTTTTTEEPAPAATTIEPEPTTTESAPAETAPATDDASGGEWETSDDDWGSSTEDDDEWGSDTTSW